MVDFPFEDEIASEPVTQERMDVPEGVHEFQVVQVLESPEKLEVRLQHDERRYGWVFCKLPKSAGWAKRIVGQLAGSLAMSQEEWLAGDAGDLVGRRVRAEIVHKQGDRLWVNVVRFMPIEQLAVEAEAVARRPVRTPAAKVKQSAPAVGSDDIPF